MDEFERAHQFTAGWEGGYVNHPSDPGGETNLGVTRRVWEAWCREKNLPVRPMKALTLGDVLPLYEARYWSEVAHLPWPLSGVAYDIAVNHGPGNLRRMLASIPTTGTPAERAAQLIDARERFYRAIVAARPSQNVFLRGWLRRVNAQREWLRANAEPTTSRVLLVPLGGGEPQPWDGKQTVYGGVTLNSALIEQLQLVYPRSGGPWAYQTLKLWRRQNGDLVLERAASTPK